MVRWPSGIIAIYVHHFHQKMKPGEGIEPSSITIRIDQLNKPFKISGVLATWGILYFF